MLRLAMRSRLSGSLSRAAGDLDRGSSPGAARAEPPSPAGDGFGRSLTPMPDRCPTRETPIDRLLPSCRCSFGATTRASRRPAGRAVLSSGRSARCKRRSAGTLHCSCKGRCSIALAAASEHDRTPIYAVDLPPRGVRPSFEPPAAPASPGLRRLPRATGAITTPRVRDTPSLHRRRRSRRPWEGPRSCAMP